MPPNTHAVYFGHIDFKKSISSVYDRNKNPRALASNAHAIDFGQRSTNIHIAKINLKSKIPSFYQ